MNTIASIAIASGIALGFAASEGNAVEHAFTTHPLGVLAFGAGITPLLGNYVSEAISFYEGSIGGNFDFGSRIFNAGLKANIFLDDVNLLFVPQGQLLGSLFGASVTVPAGYVDYKAGASGIRGTVYDETSGGGRGDMDLQFQLGWDSESFSHTAYFLMVIPTGRYPTGFYPIIGLNRSSFDLGWGFTDFDKNSELQINGAVGFMTSIENFETQYQTWNEFHAEWPIGYQFGNGLLLGVVGYDNRHSGPGAVLGPFESSGDASGQGSPIPPRSARLPWSSTFATVKSTTGRTSSMGTRRSPPLPRSSQPPSSFNDQRGEEGLPSRSRLDSEPV